MPDEDEGLFGLGIIPTGALEEPDVSAFDTANLKDRFRTVLNRNRKLRELQESMERADDALKDAEAQALIIGGDLRKRLGDLETSLRPLRAKVSQEVDRTGDLATRMANELKNRGEVLFVQNVETELGR